MKTPVLLRSPTHPPAPARAAPATATQAPERLARRVLVVGRAPGSESLSAGLARCARCDVVGVLDDGPGTDGSDAGEDGLPLLGAPADVLAHAARVGAGTVALALCGPAPPPLARALADLRAGGVNVQPLADVYERALGRVAFAHADGRWTLAAPYELEPPTRAHRVAKRALDMAGGVGLALACALALPFVALAVRLDTPGSVFYTQERVGLGGRRYRVAKFRSMVADAEAGGARWAAPSDGRVTRVGRWLRRTHVDELPQALNVLRGEMSLVGPRPERPEFLAALEARIPAYRARLAAKPGLTGWAQVNYGYGHTVEDALVKLQYDLHYLRRPSVLRDLAILARTVAVVARMRGR